MTITLRTQYTTNASGGGVIVAKALGKQRSTRWNHALSFDANYGAAVGTLLCALLDDRQKAMLLHPSGGQRVRVKSTSDNGTRQEWTISL